MATPLSGPVSDAGGCLICQRRARCDLRSTSTKLPFQFQGIIQRFPHRRALLGCDRFPATGASRKCDSAHFRKAITVKISSPVTIRQTQVIFKEFAAIHVQFQLGLFLFSLVAADVDFPDLTRGEPSRSSSPTGTPSFVPAAIAGESIADENPSWQHPQNEDPESENDGHSPWTQHTCQILSRGQKPSSHVLAFVPEAQ